jgi:hypothetical protein
MKNMKKVSYIALAALSAIATLNAQQNIYISGATAYRSTANETIDKLCGGTGPSASSNSVCKAYNHATLGSVTRGRWEYVSGGVTNNIFVSWSGSEAGIQNTAGGNDGTASKRGADHYTTAQSGLLSSSAATDNHASHICFSDTHQNASIFRGNKAGDGVNYATLTGQPVGVVGFTFFVHTNAFNAGITNVSTEQAKALLNLGNVPKSFFTGNSADRTSGVYLVGRNPDSGTRVTTLACMSYGISSLVKQYEVLSTNQIFLFRSNTVNGISVGTGNNGYASGSTIAAAIAAPLATGTNLIISTNGTTKSPYTGDNYLIGYISGGDLSGASVRAINYNGFAMNTTNIIDGNYPFWSKEYIYYSPARSNAVSMEVYNAIRIASQAVQTSTSKSQVKASGAYSAGNTNNEMRVNRQSDGSQVSPL